MAHSWTTKPVSEWLDLPPEARETLTAYVEQGREGGSFIMSLLENDLTRTVTRADSRNVHLLREYAMVLIWMLPPEAWGSREKVNEWLSHDGMKGLEDEQSNHL